MRRENSDGRINVLQLIRGLGIGGMERVVQDLCRHLAKSRFNVMACCLGKKGPLAEELEAEGYDVYLCSQYNALSRYTKGWELRRILRREKIHILHSHNTQALLDGAVGAKLAGTPVIVHTDHVRLFPDKMRYMAAEKVASYFVDGIVGVSQHVKENLIRYEKIAEEKISIISNGTDFVPCTDLEQIRTVRAELNIAPGEKVVGCVARLRPQKGYELFLETAARVLKRTPEVKFLIVGDGEEYARLVNLSNQLGVSSRVGFVGARTDVDRIMPCFDLFLLTSHYEGMPVCLLESMASAVPVVATGVGGVPEVIQDGISGCLVYSRSPERVAEKVIELLLNDDLRARMGEEARRIFENRFTVEQMVSHYTDLYEHLLAVKGSRI